MMHTFYQQKKKDAHKIHSEIKIRDKNNHRRQIKQINSDIF